MAVGDDVVIRLADVHKHFRPTRGVRAALTRRETQVVKAVDGVSLEIRRGEIVSLVGESGSGKSTLGEVLTLLQFPTKGRVILRDVDLTALSGKELRRQRRHLQVVFQDPYQTLDPRMTVLRTVREPLLVNEKVGKREAMARVISTLNQVGLAPAEYFLFKYPRELSGGQRQRVAIARALILDPELVVADEPVSMLDVSVASGILNAMLGLRARLGTAFLFITHDLAVARYMGDRIAIMYGGKIVEIGAAEEVVSNPRHPYTQLLLESIPGSTVHAKRRHHQEDAGDGGKMGLVQGCTFRFRCPFAMEQCRSAPAAYEVAPQHEVTCFLYEHPVPHGRAPVPGRHVERLADDR